MLRLVAAGTSNRADRGRPGAQREDGRPPRQQHPRQARRAVPVGRDRVRLRARAVYAAYAEIPIRARGPVAQFLPTRRAAATRLASDAPDREPDRTWPACPPPVLPDRRRAADGPAARPRRIRRRVGAGDAGARAATPGRRARPSGAGRSIVDGRIAPPTGPRLARRAHRADLPRAAGARRPPRRRRDRGPVRGRRPPPARALVLVVPFGLAAFAPAPEFGAAMTGYLTAPSRDDPRRPLAALRPRPRRRCRRGWVRVGRAARVQPRPGPRPRPPPARCRRCWRLFGLPADPGRTCWPGSRCRRRWSGAATTRSCRCRSGEAAERAVRLAAAVLDGRRQRAGDRGAGGLS